MPTVILSADFLYSMLEVRNSELRLVLTYANKLTGKAMIGDPSNSTSADAAPVSCKALAIILVVFST